MAEALPEITLTDPNNRDTEPSPEFSPSVSAVPADLNGIVKGATGRPSTPSSKTGASMSCLATDARARRFEAGAVLTGNRQAGLLQWLDIARPADKIALFEQCERITRTGAGRVLWRQARWPASSSPAGNGPTVAGMRMRQL